MPRRIRSGRAARCRWGRRTAARGGRHAMRVGRRLTVRKRLFAIAVVGALFTAVVGGVGLSGYASLTAASRAEARLGTIQSLTVLPQPLPHKARAQAWF